MEKITIDDFKKIEIRIGEILEASRMEGSDKLLVLKVDFGLKPQSGSPDLPKADLGEEKDIRQILSGISQYFENPQDLVGKQVTFVTNLEPREIRGSMSYGMILAGSGDFGLCVLSPDKKVPNGTLLK